LYSIRLVSVYTGEYTFCEYTFREYCIRFVSIRFVSIRFVKLPILLIRNSLSENV
jgi:hypothetical protein